MFIEKTLGQLCELGKGKIQTGPFGSQLHQADYSEEGTPVVMPADIIDGKISETKIARVSEDHVMRLERHQLAIGDIVYGRRGDIGRQALVTSKEEGWLCGTGCLRVTVGKNSLIDPEYLHLYLKMPDVISYIQNQAIGATMPNLNTEILKRIPIRYPGKIADQKKVIAVLKAYFDLIENNKKRIQILENIAEELYKEWFVRFRFSNWENTEFEKGIPKDWTISTLNDICNITMGQAPKSEFYNDKGEGLPFHQGVGTFGEYFPETDIYCSGKGRIANSGDILFSVRAPVGRMNFADQELIIGRGLSAISSKTNHQIYLYQMLKFHFYKEDLIGNGSIFNSVTKDELANFEVKLPSIDIIEKYEEHASEFNKLIINLYKQNQYLVSQKDSLLPRLISGKLSVESLDIQFPPSMQQQ